MGADGIATSNRVDPITYQKIGASVVDNILTGQTYGMRLLRMGDAFNGKTMDYPIKVVNGAQGEFFVGLENLGSSATDTLVTLSYAHTAFDQPIVSVMLEAFANSGPQQAIDLDTYKYEEAIAEAMAKLGPAFYGTGSSNQPLGLGAIVDDGTDVGTIGGQSRTTYTTLKATRTAASSGVISLTVLATLEDTITAGGIQSEEPNINVTTKTVWSLFEQLLQPAFRNNADNAGLAVPLAGNDIMKRSELKGTAGFTALSYRGKPVIKDDACTSGNWFMLNERYFGWKGRTTVPTKYDGQIQKVSFGEPQTIDGTAAAITPPSSAGWFMQDYRILPNQAGMIARLYLIGQTCGTQFRRQGRLTGVTTV